MAVYDETWKEAMEQWFEPFVAFFFPHVHRDIDWSRGWQSLDTELRQVTRDAELGERRADKLVKVWRRDGAETWLLIHLEVQSQYESDFPRRMFVYHYRIFDHYNRQVVSLAVLGDDRPNWRPDHFGYDLWGCDLSFRFPIVKLLDRATLRPTLETSPDPIAVMVLAHLATLEKPDDEGSRFARKRQVIRSLYDRGMTKEMVWALLRLVDWMLTLPESLEPLFRQEQERWEKEKQMPYVTSFERLAREEGQAEGQVTMLILILEQRFGAPLPEGLTARLRAVRDAALLGQWGRLAVTVASLEEFQQKTQP
jgi:hypothetical protein